MPHDPAPRMPGLEHLAQQVADGELDIDEYYAHVGWYAGQLAADHYAAPGRQA